MNLSRCAAACQSDRRGDGSQRHAALEGRAGDVEFANARRLTDAEIDTIQRWVADGAPEGDTKLLPPLRFTKAGSSVLPMAVTMAEAFECRRRGPDVYRSFVVPLNLDRDVWVRDRLPAFGACRRPPQSLLSRRNRCSAQA